MSYLEGFGYKIYRLKEVKEVDEFLLYNIRTKEYNQYSSKRLKEIIMKEILDLNIDWDKYIKEVLNLDEESRNIIYSKWIPQQVEADYILINNVDYKPVEEITFKQDYKTYFNIYKKSKYLSNSNNYIKGEFNNIKKLIENLTGNQKEEYNYFVKWLAWKLQNPLIRLPTSIILQGEHGTGKTKFCELVLKSIFENNFREIGQADINKDYNEYILGKELIVANEVIHNDNKLLVPDKLKNYVTDEYLSINRKFKDTAYMKNYTQWIFVTNNFIPLKIDNGDRRYTVFKSKKLKDGFKLISDLMKNLDEELKSFIFHLLNLEVEFNEVATPLENKAKKDIIKASQNTIDDFIEYIETENGLDEMIILSRYDPKEIFIHKDQDILISTSIFYNFYCKFCTNNGINHKYIKPNFTRYLNSIGYPNKVYKDQFDKSVRGIILKC